MIKKIRVAVLFGGRSAEHDVSVLSATNVVQALDRTRYEIVPIGITRSGEWLLLDLESDGLPKSIPTSGLEVALIPGGRGRFVAISSSGLRIDLPPIDLIFPVLHGPFGEDGSVQGYAEIAGIPYVGCGIVASAAAMDKDIAKRLLRAADLPVARSLTIDQRDGISCETIAEKMGLPLFVKPARQGSSVGVSKVDHADGLTGALHEAFRHDDKVLIEEFVKAREIECSVLEHADGRLTVSLPGEIIPADKHGFYTYDAKYLDADGATVRVPADLPSAVSSQARQMAEQAFLALACSGMARVDFFVRPDMSLVVNEINTIPGFTDISMYAKALAASGVSYGEMLETLILHAMTKQDADRRHSQVG